MIENIITFVVISFWAVATIALGVFFGIMTYEEWKKDRG